MLKLFRFKADCGRMGTLSGVFVAKGKDVERIMGKTVYFGEVLGKHSDIRITIDENCLASITDDQVFIAKFQELGLATGHNPLNYLE